MMQIHLGQLVQGGGNTARKPFVIPIPFNIKFFTIGIHGGTVSSVNIILDSAYADSKNKNNFWDNFEGAESVYVYWLSLGI